MLQLLNISNIALIDSLQVEFDSGLNLLTGETGSGKSIIVDALGVLIGGRFSSELLKSGMDRGSIEGLFTVATNPDVIVLLENAGIAGVDSNQESIELIVRREVSATGRNKIFINNQLATQTLLRLIREYLVDIHGQGEQQTLFNPETHLELLDAFANNTSLRSQVATSFARWKELKQQLKQLNQDEAAQYQLVDTLKFQIKEIQNASIAIGEDEQLEDERRRLSNVEKLTELSQGTYGRIYEDDDSVLARLQHALKDLTELAEYETSFASYIEGLESNRAMLEDLSFSLREFGDKLEFSPARLSFIEDRLVELSRLKRKYGGSLHSVMEHLAGAEDRLRAIETSDQRQGELNQLLRDAEASYLEQARQLQTARKRAVKKLEQAVEQSISEVAMENGRFQIQLINTIGENNSDSGFNNTGIDRVEFYFSANPGEELKPLARVASGGEASRLMLVLKTVANASEFPRTIVFDEIDTGIGGRVSEAVGVKLQRLSKTNQVLCVTHQAQIARFADNHLVVRKEVVKGQTAVSVERLDRQGRVEEIARMLTGAEITDSARRHARELLKK
jgi:DNA repair protein RecN (Recombination protein N)